jgi:hypothetical protein
MNKYLLTAATAFALGAGTMQVADLTAVAATPLSKNLVVEKELGAAAKQAVEAWVANNTCAEVNSTLSGDNCAVPGDVHNVCIEWSRDKTVAKVYAHYKLTGTWVWGEPE